MTMIAGLMDFIRMGGYGGYVWFCYGAAVVMQLGFFIVLWRRRRRLLEARRWR